MRNSIILLLFLTTYNYSIGQGQRENLKIVWPEEYKWKIGSNQEDESIHIMELIPGNETIEKWTIMGTMMSIKGAKNVPMDKAMNMMFDQAKLNAPDATLTLIEQNHTAKNPWALFKIEAPRFKNDKEPESQLYYIVQGESSLYSNFVALKEKKLSEDFVTKWKAIFKSSELVYQ
jgi:hypothetical protein